MRAHAMDDATGDDLAQRCADTNGRVMAPSVRLNRPVPRVRLGDHQHGYDAEDSGPNAVENLNGHEQLCIGGECVENARMGSTPNAIRRRGLRPQVPAFRPDQDASSVMTN